QRVIALAPVVAGARPAVDDQGVDLALAEARRNRKACLPAADHQHRRLGVFELALPLAQIEPVRAAEVARIRPPLRAPPAGVLFAALELLERGEKRPGPIILDAEHAGAGTLGCLEAADGLDALFSSARHGPRCGGGRCGSHGRLPLAAQRRAPPGRWLSGSAR